MRILILLCCLFPFSILFAQFDFTEIHHEYTSQEIVFADEILTADFNGDNILDFVILDHYGQELFIGLNNNFEKPDLVKINDGESIWDLALHDFDQDGDIDILGSDDFDRHTLLFRNNGDGTFELEELPIDEYLSIHFADVMGDEVEEMIMGVDRFGNSFDRKLVIYDIKNGEITFKKELFNDMTSGHIEAITSLDIDNNGLLDIAATFRNDGIKVFRNDGSDEFTQIDIMPQISRCNKLMAADVNGDQIADFFLHSSFHSSTHLFSSTAPSEYGRFDFPEPNGFNYRSSFGDLDNDNTIDLLYYEGVGISEGFVSIFPNDDGGAFGDKILVTDNYNYIRAITIEDLDNDGDQDFYFFTNDETDRGLVIFKNEKIMVIDNDNDGFAVDEDCDDNNPDINPGQTEIAYNGIDDDCNEATLDDDLDEDGFVLAEDCDDQDAGINPDAMEILDNGIDEDCSGEDLSPIHELANATIEIFPNPISDVINIQIIGTLDPDIQLMDVHGKLILDKMTINNNDVSNLPSGIYFLEIMDKNSGAKIVEQLIKTE